MELESLKKQIQEIRNKQTGKRDYYPSTFWDQVAVLSESVPPSTLAQELGLNFQNLSRQIKKRKTRHDSSESYGQFLEVPKDLLSSHKKQISLELPHGITLRIDL